MKWKFWKKSFWEKDTSSNLNIIRNHEFDPTVRLRKMKEEHEKRRQETLDFINKMWDKRDKLIGDTVVIWDMSYIKFLSDEKFPECVKKYHNKEAMVIETDCNEFKKIHTHPITGESEVVYFDLLLRFKDGSEAYCASKSVRLKD